MATTVNIAVPVEFEDQVKHFINGLLAANFMQRNLPELVLFPEAEREATGEPGADNGGRADNEAPEH